MSQHKILLIEDEPDIRSMMELHLKRAGFTVISTDDGIKAKSILLSDAFHLVIVDWMLPGISGIDLTKEMVHSTSTQGRPAILMVTARAEPTDIVTGLMAGADDYITKPFEIPVLLARVHSLLRRMERQGPKPAQDLLTLGPIEADVAAFRATISGNPLSLTKTEFLILATLLKNHGKALSRSQLIENIQGPGFAVGDRTIDIHVYSLRKKLGKYGDWIETIRGVGYRVHEV